MTNPNDAVGTNAAYDGRTSVNAFNDDLAAYTSGILSGWACTPNSGLTVSLGGDGSTRDVAVAEDNAGNKTSINNISGSPIDVTMSAAPGSNSRIDLVVAYVDNPPQGVNTTADNPSACGIIKVTGTASSSPVAPNDSAIRTAITGDGASGATAYYAILAYITISSGTTDITTSNIKAGPSARLDTDNIDFTTLEQDLSNPSNAYIQIGSLLICYGQFNATGLNTQAYSEKTFEFTFPKAFSSRPQVFAAVDDIGGYCGEYAVVNVATTTKGKIVIGHTAAASSTSCRCGWFAIGAA